LGREEDVDAAQRQMLRSLAKAVDDAPTKAALWEQYREALADLKRDIDNGDEDLRAAVEALRSVTPVGDPKK
jgi:hypothetical protein